MGLYRWSWNSATSHCVETEQKTDTWVQIFIQFFFYENQFSGFNNENHKDGFFREYWKKCYYYLRNLCITTGCCHLCTKTSIVKSYSVIDQSRFMSYLYYNYHLIIFLCMILVLVLSCFIITSLELNIVEFTGNKSSISAPQPCLCLIMYKEMQIEKKKEVQHKCG